MAMNEGTPLWQSPASSVASVAGSTVREGAAGPARAPARARSSGLFSAGVTPRMVRTATVAGLLVAMAVYIIGGTTLASTMQGVEAATLRDAEAEQIKNSRTDSALTDDGVLFLPGFGAPLEKQYAGLVGVNTLNAGKLFYWRHPEYKHNPLYVCGESYAGKYAPSISHYIHVKNSGTLDTDDVMINLTGVAIGNGDMWPVLQSRSVPDFAIALGLIDSQQYEDANAQISVCEELHRQGRDVDAFQVCQAVTQKIYEAAGNPFIYDIRQSGNTFSDVSTLLLSYFNDDAVRRALNVPPGTPWMSVDGSAYGTSPSAPALVRHLLQDEMLDVPIDVFRDLLDNYKFLFYAGNMDGSLCNNLGVGRIIDRLAWTDTAKYRVAKRQPWVVDGQVAGLAKSAGNMSYVVVLNSGHLVPADQPEASLDMMRRFINNESFFSLSP
ncbi:hypothetical protein PF011_g18176 [Phytophthora fragariae]|uniref:Carboxypeptidase n=1 Tax=Phytophthora fragariae TaxID=53985 RepID=A0A6A3J8M9_9STRA|nr:hypothetical protein PF003_g30624 [Phytophthora fragariae]KAE8990861.1 hypothetical protein PF011_g18176 [Phytophthora fragariae]